MQKVENQLWRAVDKLRDADLDAAASNFGQAKKSLRRVFDRLEEAYAAAAGDEELQAELDKIKALLESAREDLDNLRDEAREKIEQALHELDRLIGD
jgi:septation ring formation regulator EzrA